MSASPPPLPTPASPTANLVDFGDRISPMVVKELRQGLRARTFVAVFLALQGLLMLLMLISVTATSQPGEAGRAISHIVFLFYGFALLVIQPMRGIGSLHREIEANTIELMVLSHLSAWRIVLGKWISIISQSALMSISVMPYLVLRYWFGEMNLFGEMAVVVLFLLASAALTAVVVGISALPNILLRGLLPLIGLAAGIFIVPTMVFNRGVEELADAITSSSSQAQAGIFFIVALGAYFSWLALGIGASMIAPSAENQSSIKRIVTLALMGLLFFVLPMIDSFDGDESSLIMLAVLCPAIFLALSENWNLLPPHCAPFLRFGPAGQLAARFLYPGWPSGVLFSLLMLIPFAGTLAWINHRHSIDDELPLALFTMLSWVTFPAVAMLPMKKSERSRVTLGLVILVAISVAFVALAILAEALNSDATNFLWLFIWIPGVPFILHESTSSTSQATMNSLAGLIFAVQFAILVIAAMLKLKQVSKVEKAIPSA
ncbi:hypothetical protein HNR46_000311 [Haloferula luteola]|uniref:ABC-2 family transporter protein n=1 Tax=Haloferula luteola TaxID=595692 RepID=A0A840V807_9BACT|nr:hypothetical protein [Haloferula luteola]MBB5350090.1 hypothetical protein [Haloferula luteola]